jgi:hypothetical protein
MVSEAGLWGLTTKRRFSGPPPARAGEAMAHPTTAKIATWSRACQDGVGAARGKGNRLGKTCIFYLVCFVVETMLDDTTRRGKRIATLLTAGAFSEQTIA